VIPYAGIIQIRFFGSSVLTELSGRDTTSPSKEQWTDTISFSYGCLLFFCSNIKKGDRHEWH